MKKHSFTTTIFNVGINYPLAQENIKPFLTNTKVANVKYRVRVPLKLAICLYYNLNKYSKKLNSLYNETLKKYTGDELYIKEDVPFKSALDLNNLDITETTKTNGGQIKFKG